MPAQKSGSTTAAGVDRIRRAIDDDAAMKGQFVSPIIGRMRDPYQQAEIERDLNRTTSPAYPPKLSEDAQLAKGSGPIKPLSRIDLQLRGEAALAEARKRTKGK